MLKPLFDKVTGLQAFFCEDCKILKISFFIQDLLIYLMIVIDILELFFTIVQLGHVTEKTSQ